MQYTLLDDQDASVVQDFITNRLSDVLIRLDRHRDDLHFIFNGDGQPLIRELTFDPTEITYLFSTYDRLLLALRHFVGHIDFDVEIESGPIENIQNLLFVCKNNFARFNLKVIRSVVYLIAIPFTLVVDDALRLIHYLAQPNPAYTQNRLIGTVYNPPPPEPQHYDGWSAERTEEPLVPNERRVER